MGEVTTSVCFWAGCSVFVIGAIVLLSLMLFWGMCLVIAALDRILRYLKVSSYAAVYLYYRTEINQIIREKHKCVLEAKQKQFKEQESETAQ